MIATYFEDIGQMWKNFSLFCCQENICATNVYCANVVHFITCTFISFIHKVGMLVPTQVCYTCYLGHQDGLWTEVSLHIKYSACTHIGCLCVCDSQTDWHTKQYLSQTKVRQKHEKRYRKKTSNHWTLRR